MTVLRTIEARAGRTVEGVHGRFTSPLHSTRNAAILGSTLGVAFTVCFATGLLTWWIQHPPGWFAWPARPAGLYRVTQGLHVATGIASIPLLLAKLWVVYPHFWTWPAVRSVAHAIERLTLLALVGGSLFLLFTGSANIALWYPWTFSFPVVHHWSAWITMGALVAHIGAKIHLTAEALRRGGDVVDHDDSVVAEGDESEEIARQDDGGLGRRRFLAAAFGSSALLTVVTVGQTVPALSFAGLLAPRRPDDGPQGLPVNKTAAGARVLDLIDPASYRLEVRDGGTSHLFSIDDLRSLPATTATLPIACVEGWSASATWRGVRLRDLLAAAGIDDDDVDEVGVESLQPGGSYRRCDLRGGHLTDRHTLLAYDIDGEPLHPDHGFPLRLMAPNRPGVLQTKWVGQLVVTRRGRGRHET